jgi:hypothetical protein
MSAPATPKRSLAALEGVAAAEAADETADEAEAAAEERAPVALLAAPPTDVQMLAVIERTSVRDNFVSHVYSPCWKHALGRALTGLVLSGTAALQAWGHCCGDSVLVGTALACVVGNTASA